MGKGDSIGKAARNEIRKIRATYWNNLGVAIMAGGFFIPYFALYPRFYEKRGFFDHIPLADWIAVGTTLVPMSFAFFSSLILRHVAKKILEGIED
ncbi:hypothetical protein I6F35_33805 [Bradyrhizobium sp. BRP22]|uniref:hypothetical protein n=1 Tax=Bradyrhizobium sp. BRP22 TaxID=2793821 RepID=UPI001CD7FB47|nr:hypothetical protein [Bradyrhizobium sp. BRP22]MCA1458111.1 hypothetical protein [Bradyrhizobium sp. BRP22]